jgi:hypothetical protein
MHCLRTLLRKRGIFHFKGSIWYSEESSADSSHMLAR